MPTFNVAASEDDVQRVGAATFSVIATGFDAGLPGGTDYNHVAARFLNMNIPQGSTINSAYLSIVCRLAQSGITMLTNLALEDVDNAAQITSAADFDGRVLTAVVAWDNIGAWVLGNSYDTPSLVTPFQTVIDRVGWSNNNAVNVFWKDDGSSSGAIRLGASWDNATYTEPILTVTWTPPVTGSIVSLAVGAGII